MALPKINTKNNSSSKRNNKTFFKKMFNEFKQNALDHFVHGTQFGYNRLFETDKHKQNVLSRKSANNRSPTNSKSRNISNRSGSTNNNSIQPNANNQTGNGNNYSQTISTNQLNSINQKLSQLSPLLKNIISAINNIKIPSFASIENSLKLIESSTETTSLKQDSIVDSINDFRNMVEKWLNSSNQKSKKNNNGPESNDNEEQPNKKDILTFDEPKVIWNGFKTPDADNENPIKFLKPLRDEKGRFVKKPKILKPQSENGETEIEKPKYPNRDEKGRFIKIQKEAEEKTDEENNATNTTQPRDYQLHSILKTSARDRLYPFDTRRNDVRSNLHHIGEDNGPEESSKIGSILSSMFGDIKGLFSNLPKLLGDGILKLGPLLIEGLIAAGPAIGLAIAAALVTKEALKIKGTNDDQLSKDVEEHFKKGETLNQDGTYKKTFDPKIITPNDPNYNKRNQVIDEHPAWAEKEKANPPPLIIQQNNNGGGNGSPNIGGTSGAIAPQVYNTPADRKTITGH
jgi:hypothetical protein